MMMSRVARLTVLGVVTAGVSSIAGCIIPVSCDTVLGIRVQPRDTTIFVGQQFTAGMQLTNCGGTQVIAATFRFSTSDSSVATVDSLSGLVTGRSSGLATILIIPKGEYSSSSGTTRVTVR